MFNIYVEVQNEPILPKFVLDTYQTTHKKISEKRNKEQSLFLEIKSNNSHSESSNKYITHTSESIGEVDFKTDNYDSEETPLAPLEIKNE